MDLALPRHRRRSRPLIVLLVLLSVTLIAIDQNSGSGPTHIVRSTIQDLSSSIVGSVDDLRPSTNGASVENLKRQNAQLQSQLDQTRGQLEQVDDAIRQRDQLTALLNLPTPDNVPKVIAAITSIGSSNFDNTLQLSKGSNQGIAVGQPVVGSQGLIGRIVQVSGQHSTVLLIQDTTSNVGVRFPAGDIGVAVGQGINKTLRIDLIDLTSQVKQGDIAVTSGEDNSIFPPGLPVGVVSSVSTSPQNLRKDVTMTPLVDVHQLSDVAVLQWKS